MYFDEVSQLGLTQWRAGRVALVGDTCRCILLFEGEGTSMAMAGAYVLIGQLARSGNDAPGALRRYEEWVNPGTEKKQEAARRLAMEGQKNETYYNNLFFSGHFLLIERPSCDGSIFRGRGSKIRASRRRSLFYTEGIRGTKDLSKNI